MRRLSRALDRVSKGLLISAYSGLNKGLLGPSIRLNKALIRLHRALDRALDRASIGPLQGM